MLNITETVKGIAHPLVDSMYHKVDFGNDKNPTDVLVIETNFSHETITDDEDFDLCLMELLMDLPTLKQQAETQIGKFDRVDIRSAN